ncbi:type II CAAX endopeptidase family protein [Lentilactobacillus sp. Marseille-Q4993]|uniref:CPBP family intramembrane glutamic endopeptidase n=1 Tax=Lentilactobacillus sp. Marseille-Q4993 TaxID=3039492 RepID=UPI0024BC49F0|nr:type II CAAX endopeptidase family protein [Lentilactobacillus sp. Marseille-Q4993]
MKQLYLKTRDIVIIILVAFLLSLTTEIVPKILSWTGISSKISNIDFQMIIILWSEIVGVFIILGVFRNNHQIAAVDFTDWPKYLKGLLGGAGLFGLVWIASVLLKGYSVSWVFNFGKTGIILLFFGGFLIQSFFEEVLCRGFVLGYFLTKHRVVTGVVVNSFVFAVMHLGNSGVTWLAGLNLILFSVVMSFVRLVWGNLLINGAIHGSWNFAEGVLFGTSVSGTPNIAGVWQSHETSASSLINGGEFGLEASFICFVVYAVVLYWLVIKYKNNKKHEG